MRTKKEVVNRTITQAYSTLKYNEDHIGHSFNASEQEELKRAINVRDSQ